MGSTPPSAPPGAPSPCAPPEYLDMGVRRSCTSTGNAPTVANLDLSDSSLPREMRLAGVAHWLGESIDLVITETPGSPNHAADGGVCSGSDLTIGGVMVQNGNTLHLTFTLEKTDTHEEFAPSEWQVTFIDIENGNDSNETVWVYDADDYVLTPNTVLINPPPRDEGPGFGLDSFGKAPYRFSAISSFEKAQNPQSALHLSGQAARVSAVAIFRNVSSFDMRYQVGETNNGGTNYRRVFFGLASNMMMHYCEPSSTSQATAAAAQYMSATNKKLHDKKRHDKKLAGLSQKLDKITSEAA